MKKNINKKGFTLVELMVTIAIVGILAMLLIPSMMHYVRKARVAAAIADARTIKVAVETALVDYLAATTMDTGNAFNKQMYTDSTKKTFKRVGAFTNYTWYMYKNGEIKDPKNDKNNTMSQIIEYMVCKSIDNSFSEDWKKGQKVNQLKQYTTSSKTCADYLADTNNNFGLVIVYDSAGGVHMMQLYRKNILVSYVNGEYLANLEDDAHFIGKNDWSTIYTDIGEEAPESIIGYSLGSKQYSSVNNSWIGWI